MLSYYPTHALSVRSKLLPKRYGSRNIQWTELRRIRTSPAMRLRRRLQHLNETRDEETESGVRYLKFYLMKELTGFSHKFVRFFFLSLPLDITSSEKT